MGKLILLDTRIFIGGADFSGNSNKLEISEEAEAKETTNFRSGGAKEILAGVTSVDITGEGQWEAGTSALVDDATWAQRRELAAYTAAPAGDSDTSAGGLMYLTRALRTKSTLWGNLGDVAGWQANAKGTWPLVRGVVAHPSGTVRSATGQAAGIQLGAVPAGSKLYANLHVLSITGTATPSIAVKIQSDNANSFASPVDVLTFATKNAVGGESIRTNGTAITDDWFRVSWTITGTTPGFLFLVALGIESR